MSAPGIDTVGVDSPGSESHIITTTRRYGNASTMLVTTPAITSQVCPPSSAGPKTANLLVKPLVSGMPAKASRMNVNSAGVQRRTPAQPGPAGQVGGLAVGVADQGHHARTRRAP